MGCGKIAGYFSNRDADKERSRHAWVFKSHEYFQVAGCVDVDLARAKRFSDTVGIPYSGDNVGDAVTSLHPDVVVRLDQENNLASLALKNGEVWIFNYSLDLHLQLEPTIFFENGLFEPLESKKLILSTDLLEYGTRIKWSLVRALDKDLSVGDLF